MGSVFENCFCNWKKKKRKKRTDGEFKIGLE